MVRGHCSGLFLQPLQAEQSSVHMASACHDGYHLFLKLGVVLDSCALSSVDMLCYDAVCCLLNEKLRNTVVRPGLVLACQAEIQGAVAPVRC